MTREPITSVPASAVKTEILIAWLYEGSKQGAMTNKSLRRLCWLAAEKLTSVVKTGELPK
jgi:hypothetical protein